MPRSLTSSVRYVGLVRADRLLAELLLLQVRGQVTAAQFADELEVSERTVYRDMAALQIAGVPVIALTGPGGGYSLFGDWRSDLTGLSADEVTALSVAMVASPVPDGKAGRRLQAAMLKITAALPESTRRAVEHLQHRVHIDPSPSAGSSQRVLSTIAAALQDGLGLDLVLRGPFGNRLALSGTPLGLVAGAGSWYLVWAPRGGRPRAEHLDDVLEVTAGAAADGGPAEFDLAGFWKGWQERAARHDSRLQVKLRVTHALLPVLRRRFGPSLSVEADDPLVVRLGFRSIEAARAEILSWGGAAEVLEPRAVRHTVADFAEQAAAAYRE